MSKSRQQISTEAHRDLPHANPLSVAQMRHLLEKVLSRQPRSILDVGCGAGEFSIALAAHQDVHVTALDINPYALERARAAASKAKLEGQVDFQECAATEYIGGPFDVAICIGSSQALGTPREALTELQKYVRPGGALIFAELCWSSTPSKEFLEFLGTPESHYWKLLDTEAVSIEAGLSVELVLVATEESWAAYENGFLQGRLNVAKTLPAEEAAQLTANANNWYKAFLEQGRKCLGFVAVVATRHAA